MTVSELCETFFPKCVPPIFLLPPRQTILVVFFQKFFWIDIYVEYIFHSVHFQILYIVIFQMYFQLYVVGCFFIQ